MTTADQYVRHAQRFGTEEVYETAELEAVAELVHRRAARPRRLSSDSTTRSRYGAGRTIEEASADARVDLDVDVVTNLAKLAGQLAKLEPRAGHGARWKLSPEQRDRLVRALVSYAVADTYIVAWTGVSRRTVQRARRQQLYGVGQVPNSTPASQISCGSTATESASPYYDLPQPVLSPLVAAGV